MKQPTQVLVASLLTVIGIAVVWMGNHLGLWWLTIVAGFCLGLVLRGPWTLLITSSLVALGGWGLDLLWQSLQSNMSRDASVVAGIVGLGGGNGAIIIILTLVLAWVFCLSGTWVGVALRRMVMAMRYDARHGQAKKSEEGWRSPL